MGGRMERDVIEQSVQNAALEAFQERLWLLDQAEGAITFRDQVAMVVAGEMDRVSGRKPMRIGEADQLIGREGEPVGKVVRGGELGQGEVGQRWGRAEDRRLKPGFGAAAGLPGVRDEALGGGTALQSKGQARGIRGGRAGEHLNQPAGEGRRGLLPTARQALAEVALHVLHGPVALGQRGGERWEDGIGMHGKTRPNPSTSCRAKGGYSPRTALRRMSALR
jgi:hypothetical protein